MSRAISTTATAATKVWASWVFAASISFTVRTDGSARILAQHSSKKRKKTQKIYGATQLYHSGGSRRKAFDRGTMKRCVRWPPLTTNHTPRSHLSMISRRIPTHPFLAISAARFPFVRVLEILVRLMSSMGSFAGEDMLAEKWMPKHSGAPQFSNSP